MDQYHSRCDVFVNVLFYVGRTLIEKSGSSQLRKIKLQVQKLKLGLTFCDLNKKQTLYTNAHH